MGTKKITITVDEAVLDQARAEVAAGRASSISAYAAEAMTERSTRERDLAAMEERWGPIPPEAMEWAQKALRGELLLPGQHDDQRVS